MIAPFSPWHVIGKLENTSRGGGLGSGGNDTSMLPLACNSKVGEHLTGWGLETGVNDCSLLPLVCNSKVGEHFTGWGFGVWGE